LINTISKPKGLLGLYFINADENIFSWVFLEAFLKGVLAVFQCFLYLEVADSSGEGGIIFHIIIKLRGGLEIFFKHSSITILL
jgi:hypothetical protein